MPLTPSSSPDSASPGDHGDQASPVGAPGLTQLAPGTGDLQVIQAEVGDTRRPTSPRMSQILLTVLAVASGLVTIWAWQPLESTANRVAATGALLLAAGFIWVISTMRAHQGERFSWPLLIGLVVTLLACTATSILAFYPLGTPVAPAATPPVSIVFPTDGALVSACTPVKMSGDVPAGRELWVFVGFAATKPTAQPDMEYWVTDHAVQQAGYASWLADRVGVGGTERAGLKAQIFAVLVPKEWSEYFEQGNAQGKWHSLKFPPGAIVSRPVDVVRTADPGKVSCAQT